MKSYELFLLAVTKSLLKKKKKILFTYNRVCALTPSIATTWLSVQKLFWGILKMKVMYNNLYLMKFPM